MAIPFIYFGIEKVFKGLDKEQIRIKINAE